MGRLLSRQVRPFTGKHAVRHWHARKQQACERVPGQVQTSDGTPCLRSVGAVESSAFLEEEGTRGCFCLSVFIAGAEGYRKWDIQRVIAA
jgi:hypothetical protein